MVVYELGKSIKKESKESWKERLGKIHYNSGGS